MYGIKGIVRLVAYVLVSIRFKNFWRAHILLQMPHGENVYFEISFNDLYLSLKCCDQIFCLVFVFHVTMRAFMHKLHTMYSFL